MSIKSIHVRKRIVIQPEPYNSQEIEVALTGEIGIAEDFEQVKANLVGEVNALLIEEAQSAIDALDNYKRNRWLVRLGASTPAITVVIEQDDEGDEGAPKPDGALPFGADDDEMDAAVNIPATMIACLLVVRDIAPDAMTDPERVVEILEGENYHAEAEWLEEYPERYSELLAMLDEDEDQSI